MGLFFLGQNPGLKGQKHQILFTYSNTYVVYERARFSAGTSSRSIMSISSWMSAFFCGNEMQMYSTGGSSFSRYSASSMSFAVNAALS